MTIPRGALTAVALIAAASVQVVSQAADSGRHPDFSGIWEVSAGDWTIPQTAKLTAEAKAYEDKANAERAQGKVLDYSSRWCIASGVPFIMGQSNPIDIVQSAKVVGIYAEQNSMARYVYLDGRTHPDRSTFWPTTDGHSIGHWEGNELVVDTTDFSSQGHRDIPGGGYRTTSSHLIEHFKLGDGGNSLAITFRWEDPAVYREPHTYMITYHRVSTNGYAYEDVCDASDAAAYDSSGGVTDPPPVNGAEE